MSPSAMKGDFCFIFMLLSLPFLSTIYNNSTKVYILLIQIKIRAL